MGDKATARDTMKKVRAPRQPRGARRSVSASSWGGWRGCVTGAGPLPHTDARARARLTLLAPHPRSQAGVPTVPGSEGLIENDQQALQVANEVGFPLMIKATAGGGGRCGAAEGAG